MKLRFTPQALSELDDTLTDIAERSPQGARRVQTRIRATLALMLRHPESGRSTSLAGLRRIVVNPYPYLIFYEISDDTIVVVGVRHAMRDPNSMPGGGET